MKCNRLSLHPPFVGDALHLVKDTFIPVKRQPSNSWICSGRRCAWGFHFAKVQILPQSLLVIFYDTQKKCRVYSLACRSPRIVGVVNVVILSTVL